MISSVDASLSDVIQFWALVISGVIMLASVLQVLVTFRISFSIRNAAQTTESLNNMSRINAQWQEFNKLVILDENFRKTHIDLEGSTEPENVIKIRYMMFFILNIIADNYYVQKANIDKFNHAETNFRDQIRLLMHQKEILLSILDGDRGYTPDFIAACKAAME